MPNWCSNALVIREGVESFRKYAMRGNKFKFKYSVPIPEALEDVTVGSRVLNGQQVRVWRETPDGPIEVDTELLRQSYGYDNWYDWAIANWGTKWDLSERDTLIEERDGDLWIWFDTAWGPPLQWAVTAASRYPGWSGELAYAEGGMGFWGVLRFGSGVILDDDYNDGDFWDGIDEEEEDEDEDLDGSGEESDEDGSGIGLTTAVQEHLEKYRLHTGG